MDVNSDLTDSQVYYQSNEYLAARIAYESSVADHNRMVNELALLMRTYAIAVPVRELGEMPQLWAQAEQMARFQLWDQALQFSSALVYLLEGVIAQVRYEIGQQLEAMQTVRKPKQKQH